MNLHSQIVGEGRPVVILHGFLGMGDNWKSLALSMAQKGNQVHLVDQRNHGRSFHHAAFNYELLTQDLKAYLDQQGLERIILLGHSMGGKTAIQFAVDFPDMLDKLVVVDIAPKKYKGGHQTIFEALLSVNLEQVQDRKEVETQLSKYIDDVGVRLFLMKNLSRKKEGGFAWKMNLQEIYMNYSNILDEIIIDPAVSNETLFVNGGKSAYVSLEDQAFIKTCFTQVQFQTIEDAGHWVHAEQPQALIHCLNSFLDQ